MHSADPRAFLGREFIAYVADAPEHAVDEAVADRAHPLHEPVHAALRECQAFLSAASFGIHERVAEIPAGRDVSAGNCLRLAAGNELPPLPSSDDLVRPLAAIARDIYPALLLPGLDNPSLPHTPYSPPHRLLGNSVELHPAASEFADLFRGDPLAPLFDVEEPPAFFSFASGMGGAIETSAIPAALLGAACTRARLMEPHFTLPQIVDQLQRIVEDLRAIHAGNRIRMPVVVSLQGLNAEPGLRCELPWGWLRAVDQHSLKAVGDVMPPGGALFVTEVTCTVAIGGASAPEGPPMIPTSMLRAFETELEQRIQKMALSLLLLDEQPRIAAVPTRTVSIGPFFGLFLASRGYRPEPVPGVQGSLRSDSLPELLEIASLVEDRYASALAIPARRLVSALSARHDIEDGLVDAVVAWESLFAGTDAGELSFRIAAAMAWLLGATPEQRLELHREISALYGQRSRILHRGSVGRDVSAERRQAVDFGVRALRALLDEHPDLVPDENRGKKLIMRGEGPIAQ